MVFQNVPGEKVALSHSDAAKLIAESGQNYIKKAGVKIQILTEKRTYTHSWGIQEMGPGDVEMTRPDGSVYGCGWEEFCLTYAPAQDEKGTWRKIVPVPAVQLARPVTLVIRDSTTPAHYPAGSWLIQNPGKENDFYCAEEKFFAENYVPA